MADPEKRVVGMAGLYDDPDSLVRAARQVRDAGYTKWDCHSPFPVHGLEKAMGLRSSPMPFLTITAAFAGLATALLLTGGLSALFYPIHVGGKAFFSWQAFVPIFFELFVLFAAAATMGGVILLCRLGRWHSPLHDSGIMRHVTGARFAVVLSAKDAKFSEEEGAACVGGDRMPRHPAFGGNRG